MLKRRLDLKPTQVEVAECIGGTERTVNSRERIRVRLGLHVMPKFIEFVGNDPCETEIDSFGGANQVAAQAAGSGLTRAEQSLGS